MIGIGTCGAIALAIQQGQLNMIQDAKRYRALRWLTVNDQSEDEHVQHIIETLPEDPLPEGIEHVTNADIDKAFDILVAHLDANGVDLS